MELRPTQFQPVIDDLESRGAAITILAYVQREIDYTILAEWESVSSTNWLTPPPNYSIP